MSYYGIMKTNNFFHRHLLILALPCLTITLGGCNVTNALYAIFIDPLIPAPTVDAEYSLEDTTVLIWIDDTAIGPKHHSLRRELTASIHSDLEEHEAVGVVVAYEKIAQFRMAHPEYIDMSIQELGKRLQAEQVLYLFVNQFHFHHEAGQEYYQPGLSGSCKIVDVSTGERVWPKDQSYRSFTVNQPMIEGKGAEFEDNLMQKLGVRVAEEIAPYFYKHKLTD
jgi:hypothetical protein